MNQTRFQKYLFAQGTAIMLLYACMYAVPVTLLYTQIALGKLPFILALITWIVASWYLLRWTEVSPFHRILSLSITMMVLVLSGIFFAKVYDVCFDSQWYHMDAVILLRDGWNPVYKTLINPETTGGGAVYLNHFTLAPWITETGIFILSGSLESGKCLTLFLGTGVFFSAWFLFHSILHRGPIISFAFALLIAANPVILLSSYSFYIDGHVAAFVTYVCIFMISYLVTEKKYFLVLSLIAGFLLAHSKLNGSVYSIILFASFLLCLRIIKKSGWLFVFKIGALWGIITLVVFGFHPFVSNWINNGHPLFPAVGNNSVIRNSMNGIYPSNFQGKNKLQKFIIALESKAEWSRTPDAAVPKKYFDLNPLWHYGDGVSDCGGWGPFIPEVVYLMLPLLFIACIIRRKENQLLYEIAFITIILISVFVNPESWITRYVPQLWFVFVTCIYIISKIPFTRFLTLNLILLFLLSNYLMFSTYTYVSINRSNNIKKIFTDILPLQKQLVICPGYTRSFRYRMWEAGFDTTTFQKISVHDTTACFLQWGMETGFKPKLLNGK